MATKAPTKKAPDLTKPFIVIGVIVGFLAIAIALVIHFSDKIIVDPCASPCGDQTWLDGECPDVCVEVTLHDYLFGRK